MFFPHVSRRSLLTTLVGLVSLLVAFGAWALSSPIGASPDEDYHLASIWCGRGEVPGACERGDESDSREVPLAIREAACFAFKADQSAQCQAIPFAEGDTLVETTRGNFVGDYPPVFYAAMSVFVGSDPSVSVLVMRMVNAVLFLALATTVCLLVPVGMRRAVVLGFAVTSVPFGMFLVPSINPSSWAIMSVPLAFVAALGMFRAPSLPRTLALGLVAGIATLMGAGARADAALFVALAFVAAGVVGARLRRSQWPHLAYVGLLAAVSVWSFLTAGQSGAVTAERKTPFTWLGLIDLTWAIPNLWLGNFGTWGLGWLDTGLPAIVYVTGWGLFAAAVFVGLGTRGVRHGLAVAAVAGASFVVPTYIQYVSDVPVGTGVQPRYILPLLILLGVVALTRLRSAAVRLSPVQWGTVVVGLAVINAVSLHVNTRRYVTGADVRTLNLDSHLEWWWGLPIGPFETWLIGSVAFAVALALLSFDLTRPALAERILPLRRPAPEAVPEDAAPTTPAAPAPAGDDIAGDAVEPSRTA